MAQEHAHVVFPPPLGFAPSLAAGLLVHFLWQPLRLFPEPWQGHAAGWPVVVVALLLFGWAVLTMTRAGTSPEPHKPTARLVAHGPFKLSRNPIYVSYALAEVGIGLLVNSAWLLILLPAAIVLMHYGVIRREEAYLDQRFSDEYREYKQRVRRWF